MRFVFDIGVEHVAISFLSADVWASMEDAAARILTRMAEHIPMFQQFFAQFACGELFDFMVRQGPDPTAVAWDFTQDGIRLSDGASFVSSALAGLVS